jgi:hypothetical protein
MHSAGIGTLCNATLQHGLPGFIGPFPSTSLDESNCYCIYFIVKRCLRFVSLLSIPKSSEKCQGGALEFVEPLPFFFLSVPGVKRANIGEWSCFPLKYEK